MNPSLKKLSLQIGVSFLIFSGVGISYAALSTVNSGDSLTHTMWNEVINSINNFGFDNGNVGIGISTPGTDLHILGNDSSPNAALRIQSDDTPNATASIELFSRDASNVNQALTITASTGNLGIGTTSATEKLDVNGVALSNFEGFSYFVNNATINLGWNTYIIPDLEYNTFSGVTYNTSTGVFTAPRDGFYRFNLHGYSNMVSSSGSDRYALGIHVNNVLKAFSGGNYSTPDSPMATFSHIVQLSAGDTVRPAIYSSITGGAIGNASWSGHEFYFQGEFIGK